MLPQHTPPDVIEHERRLVQQLAGVGDIRDVTLNDGGWTSRVYIVNDGQFVVKFPRGAEVKLEYACEVCALRLLETITSAVQVPRLLWSHPDNDYLGYEGIVGRQFAQVSASTDSGARKAIGRAIGAFLTQFHALTLDGASAMTLPAEIEEFQSKYKLGLPVISRDFTTREQGALETLIEEDLPRELLRCGDDPMLCHGDLGLWNMILKADGRIGIIDFGDAGYYDRSKDFMGLRDPDLLDAALDAYGDSDSLRRKISLRQKILYILDLPFFIGKGDEDGIGKTVAAIKAAIA
jgi:aminoglycoside phosphotransferase (APT) family kinase protein